MLSREVGGWRELEGRVRCLLTDKLQVLLSQSPYRAWAQARQTISLLENRASTNYHAPNVKLETWNLKDKQLKNELNKQILDGHQNLGFCVSQYKLASLLEQINFKISVANHRKGYLLKTNKFFKPEIWDKIKWLPFTEYLLYAQDYSKHFN